MNKWKTSLIVLVGLLVAGSAIAQSAPLQGGTISAADLLDRKVEGRDGERIGTVSDLIVDTSGSVAYIVVSHDGIRGFNDRLTPIPVSAFDERPGRNALVLDMDRDRLERAPHFAKQDWPPNYDRERWEAWDRDVRGYYSGSDFVHGAGGGVGSGGSDSPNTPGTGSVTGSGQRGKKQ
jgi:hypothetical protein